MTDAQAAALRALAEKATPGPWEWVNGDDDSPWDGAAQASLRTVEQFGESKTVVVDGKSYTSFRLPKFVLEAEDVSKTDAAYIAACSPDVILSLLAERERLLVCVRAADAMREWDRYAMSGEPHAFYDNARAALETGADHD